MCVKHVTQFAMSRMTVREVRLKWPEAERRLEATGEIIITRDSKPVARLLPYAAPTVRRRKRFDPEAHMRWLRKEWKGRMLRVSTDEFLDRDRSD